MAIQNNITYFQRAYVHDTTTNQSFVDMHYYLKAKGIKNNVFHLVIYDPDLMGVDPRDPNLTIQMKAKIFKECRINFWYFIREVVRIPQEGGDIGSGTRYQLHRGNLAMNYLFTMNISMFVEFPRQHGKTTAAICWYLWVFNFGSTNTKMMFINKKHDDARKNLKDLKRYRDALPDYLKMDAPIDSNGKKIRVPNTVDTLQHPINYNVILTLPAAPSKAKADGAGRGATMAIQYYDEFAFMLHNRIIYNAAYPAFSRASENARRNGAPYGMLITTTPGDMTTEEGQFANNIRLDATEWNEDFYNLTPQQLYDVINSNKNTQFVHIRYTYQQLGSGEDYFAKQVTGLNRDWAIIRREVLLEWSTISNNCPFTQEDLNVIESLCMKEPLHTLYFGNHGQYQLKIWSQLPMNSLYPPIIGVDVANGWGQDSSAITIIDSETTKVIATFNCNFIPHQDLAQMIFDIVTKYMRNAIINIERNGVAKQQTSACRVTCMFSGVNCLEKGQESYLPQRDLKRCA